MTNQELITILQLERESAITVAQRYIDDSDALEMIAMALEKQTPQKPIVDRCPKCNELVHEPRNILNELYADTTFCSRCGQSLLWEDENV